MTEHDHIIESLTWYVNGTLDARQQGLVQKHLERCALCRKELALQQQIHGAITQPAKVEFAPQTSFNKLWDRIKDEQFVQAGQNQFASPARRWLALPRFELNWLIDRWIPITLSVQFLIIAGLTSVLWIRSGESPATYRTVTSTADPDRPIIHTVFDEATRLSDVKDILNKAGLEVASGPTTAGVYSLTPDTSRSTPPLNEVVVSLRNDPRVRFAELSHQ